MRDRLLGRLLEDHKTIIQQQGDVIAELNEALAKGHAHKSMNSAGAEDTRMEKTLLLAGQVNSTLELDLSDLRVVGQDSLEDSHIVKIIAALLELTRLNGLPPERCGKLAHFEHLGATNNTALPGAIFERRVGRARIYFTQSPGSGSRWKIWLVNGMKTSRGQGKIDSEFSGLADRIRRWNPPVS